MDDICTTIPTEVITTHILPLRPFQWLSVSRYFYDKALLLAAPKQKLFYIYQLVDYISRGNIHAASIFLSLVNRYPSHNGNIAFDYALNSKSEDLLQLFVKHPLFDAHQKIIVEFLPHETPLEALIRRHFNSTAKLMLQLGVDASIEHNIALIAAIESNNQEMFDILIQDPRVDLSAPVDTEITWVDPTTWMIYERGTNEPIICASKKGNLHMVQQLLLDSRVDVSVGDFKPFKEAARKGHLDVLQFLAQHPVSEIALHSALEKACANGHAHIVEWLFAAYQEDYESYDPYEIFQHVTNNNYPEVASLLLQNQYLKITYFDNAIEKWKRHGNQAIVDMIIQYKQNSKSAEKRKAVEELQGHPKKKQKSNDE